MKLSLFAIFLLLMFSCTNYNVDKVDTSLQESQDQYNTLISNIEDLNSTYERTQTRSFFGRVLNRFLKVVAADVIGGVKGAFRGDNIWQAATGASLNSAKKQGFITGVDFINTTLTRSGASYNDSDVTHFLNPKSMSLQNLILVEDSVSATINDSIGYYHNMIIYSTLENNNSLDYWKVISDNATLLELNEEIINTIPAGIYNDTILCQETIDFCNFISTKSLECQDYHALFDVTSLTYPELRNVIRTASVFFEGMELVSNDEEWYQYCKNVLRIISNSDISDADKNTLKIGLSVGYASSKLWKSE